MITSTNQTTFFFKILVMFLLFPVIMVITCDQRMLLSLDFPVVMVITSDKWMLLSFHFPVVVIVTADDWMVFEIDLCGFVVVMITTD